MFPGAFVWMLGPVRCCCASDLRFRVNMLTSKIMLPWSAAIICGLELPLSAAMICGLESTC